MTTIITPDTAATDPAATATEPLPYHRLALRTVPARWWRPLVVLATALAFYAVLVVSMFAALTITALAVPAWQPALDRAMSAESMNNPGSLGVMLLLIALMLPATMLATRVVGRRRPGTLLSVTGRLRWPMLGRAALVTVVVLAVFQGIALLLDPGAVGRPVELGRLLPALALVLVITPWQAAAEEIVFRGLLMQTLGSWLRHPAWAILLPTPLFVIGHDYNAIGLIDIAVFAIIAGYLTWRTGGLEAAIGLHVVNNVVGLSIGLLIGADLDATEISVLATGLSIAYTVIAAALILIWHRRVESRAGRLQSNDQRGGSPVR